MKIKIALILAAAFLLIFINSKITYSQIETSKDTAGSEEIIPETLWVWGEVTLLDAANKAVTVKYLEYETDQEKEMIIRTDDKTAFENVKSLDEIKPKDTLSIDYIIGANGQNIAKNISVERPESQEPVKLDEAATQDEPVGAIPPAAADTPKAQQPEAGVAQ